MKQQLEDQDAIVRRAARGEITVMDAATKLRRMGCSVEWAVRAIEQERASRAASIGAQQ